jgi:hypothetical protein
MLRAVTRWLNILVCLGTKLFSPSVLVEEVGGGGHQIVECRDARSADDIQILVTFFFLRDAVREG